MVDTTPDPSHKEQTTFLLRYVLQNEGQFSVVERFLKYIDCNKKTGEEIAQMIMDTMVDHHILLADIRAQSYDNGANMSDKYKGVQAKILAQYPAAIFSPCG